MKKRYWKKLVQECRVANREQLIQTGDMRNQRDNLRDTSRRKQELLENAETGRDDAMIRAEYWHTRCMVEERGAIWAGVWKRTAKQLRTDLARVVKERDALAEQLRKGDTPHD